MRFKNPKHQAAVMCNLKQPHPDSHRIRQNIVGEHEAVIKYQDDARKSNDPNTRKVLLDIAREEMTHVGELDALLKKVEPIQAVESKKGKAEIDEINNKR